jgi:hypothetical protein
MYHTSSHCDVGPSRHDSCPPRALTPGKSQRHPDDFNNIDVKLYKASCNMDSRKIAVGSTAFCTFQKLPIKQSM